MTWLLGLWCHLRGHRWEQVPEYPFHPGPGGFEGYFAVVYRTRCGRCGRPDPDGPEVGA